MKHPGFLGGSHTIRSVNANVERSINVYPEYTAPGNAKSPIVMPKRPGYRLFHRLASGPIRALFYQDGRQFAISGPFLYELFQSGSVAFRDEIAWDNRPATIHSNGSGGNQLFIVSGGLGYIYNLLDNTVTRITASAFPNPCTMGEYVDGYFIALLANSSQFFISNLFDGLLWNGLDTAQVSQVSDQVRAIVINHRELWLFGTKHTTPWYDSGNPSFPFQPIQGTVIHHGIAAPFTAKRFDNSILWVGHNEDGARVVWRAQGVAPLRVSDHGVEYALGRAPSIDDAIAWAYQDEGHTFYVLYVPSLEKVPGFETTWVYDAATQRWHERALWEADHGHFLPDLGRCHSYAWNRQHLVGDRRTGAVYVMSHDYLDDAVVVP